MNILFLHGWQSTPGGVKPTHLTSHGHTVLNPALPDDDFDAAVGIAQAEYDHHHPDVLVGSSRGGAVALNIDSGDTPLVLLCPAWKRWGTATTVKRGTVILHSPADETIPFADSQELFRNSGLTESVLIAVGTDHRLADSEPLKAMLEAVRLAIPTLCLGIDVTWWGGSTRYRVSQRDTIVHTIFQNGFKSDLQFSTVDLSRAPNPRSDQPTEANFDADARLLAGEVSRILNDNRERFVRCIVALDAPLEAMVRPDQPPRVKAVRKGQTTGAKRRQCECEIQAHQSNANIGHQRAWNADLRIQSGSPVPSRITNLLRELAKWHCLLDRRRIRVGQIPRLG